jgi:hypothetical protein
MDWTILQRPEVILWPLLKWILIWVILSVAVYFFIKRPLRRFGARAWRWLRRKAGEFRQIGAPLGLLLQRASAAFEEAGDKRSVRVAIGTAHKTLRDAISKAVESIRAATQDIRGLGGGRGDGLTDEIRKLKEATEAAAQQNELPPDLDVQYGERLRAIVAFGFVLILASAFAIANGLLMMSFMREMINVRIAGINLSQIVAIVVVLLEIGIGYGLGMAGRQKNLAVRAILIVGLLMAAGISAWFEYHVFGLVNGAQAQQAGGVVEILGGVSSGNWLAPFGVGFVIVSCIMGFFLHSAFDELSTHIGKYSLGRELRAVNAFVRKLPQRWEAIDAKARKAEASIEGLVGSLGARGDAVTGTVKQIGNERKAMEKALVEANVVDWANLVDGHAGDRRWSAAQNLGALALTLVAGLGCAFVFSLIFTPALAGLTPPWGARVLGLTLAAAFLTVGLLSFNRLHFVVGDGGRPEHVYPKLPDVASMVGAGLLAFGALAGLIWASVRVFGVWGVLVGLLVALISGPALAFCGYHLERSMRAIAMLTTILLAAVVSLALAVWRALVWLFIVLLFAVFIVISLIVSLLAAPAEAISKAVAARLARPASPPASHPAIPPVAA